MGHYAEVIGYQGGISEDLKKVLGRLDPRRIAVNFSLDDTMSDGLTHGMCLTLQKALAGTPYGERLESAAPVVSALRGRKSATERARIQAACASKYNFLKVVREKILSANTICARSWRIWSIVIF